MNHAAFQIDVLPGAVRCVWAPPDGAPIDRERYVHPDDLAAAETSLDSPPASLASLELVGTRIYSRLLDREVRQAVFSHHPCEVLLETNTPQIPWELACSDGRFLFELHRLGRGPQSPQVDPTSALNVLVVANPTGDLPWSEGEAAQITERLKHVPRVRMDILTGASATRDAILGALEAKPYTIVHFSCHAEFNSLTPERSFLQAFDGPVEARDLFQTAVATGPALTVLNACESGKIGGQECTSGLAAAFRSLGASSVIGARWPVNNKSSAFWMSQLYAGLVSGENIGTAAWNAQSESRRLFSNDPMLTWAAFALYGAPWMRLVEAASPVRLGRAPLAGRERQWAVLEEAWRIAQAGRGSVVAIIGPSGSGKTRLLEDFISSLPPADVVKLDAARNAADVRNCRVVCYDGFDQLDVSERRALARMATDPDAQPRLLIVTARDVGCIDVPPQEFTALSLPQLTGKDLMSVFESLGATPPPGLREASPAEAERLALGLPRGDSVEVLANALPENARSVLRAAAVWGTAFSASEAGELVGMARPDLWRSLEALCARSWIVEDSPGQFHFRDPLDRDAVLEAFRPLGERLEWERRAAGVCARAGKSEQAGEHWEAAGDRTAAVEEFTRAFHAANDAADVLRLNSALARLGAPPPDSARVAAAYGEVGRWQESRDCWERIASRARTGDALLCLAQACLRCSDLSAASRHLRAAQGLADEIAFKITHSEYLLMTGVPRVARDQARRAAEGAVNEREACLAARAALIWAQAALLLAEPDDAIRACELGMDSQPDARAAAALGRSLAQARQYKGDYAAAESALRALTVAEGGDSHSENRDAALLALAELCRDQGRLTEAHKVLDEPPSAGVNKGHTAHLIETANVRSSVLRREGRYEEALKAAQEAHRLSSSAGLMPEQIRAQIHVATALTEMGSLADARSAALAAQSAAQSAGYTFGAAWAANVLGLAGIEAGDIDAAESALLESRKLSESIHGHIGVASAAHLLAWCGWARGDLTPELFDHAERLAARISYRAVQCSASFGAALCRGDVTLSEGALRKLEALNMGAALPWLREKRGRWILGQGRFEEALRDLAPACRVARRLGMRALQGRAAAALADVYDAVGDPLAEATRREAEALTTESLERWHGLSKPAEQSV